MFFRILQKNKELIAIFLILFAYVIYICYGLFFKDSGMSKKDRAILNQTAREEILKVLNAESKTDYKIIYEEI